MHRSLPNNAAAIAAIAFIHRRQGKWRQALAELQQATELDPRNPRWPDESGVTLMALRRYGEAGQQFDRALAIEPDNYYVLTRKIRTLFLAGEFVQARRVLAKIPAGDDPQGLISGIRYESAFLAREPDRALAALTGAPVMMQGPDTLGEVPASLLRAEAWNLKGDAAHARQSYTDACATLQAAVHREPDNPDLWSVLGEAEAGLGEKDAALRDGRHATQLFPVSKDVLAGPFYLATLAQIYARLSEPDQAVKLLARLLAMLAGRVVSVPLLRLDPGWDLIRRDPDFRALLKRYGKRAPVATTTAASFTTAE